MTDSPIREFGQVERLYEALSMAQGEFTPIEKKRVGIVKGENAQGKAYNFKYFYADLADVHSGTRPALTKYGLTHTQLPVLNGMQMILVTRLAHRSGAWIESDYPVSSLEKLAHQKLGAALTYARRNALSAILGIAAEDDIDSGEGNEGDVDDRAEWHGRPTPAPGSAPPRQAPPKAAEPPRRAPPATQADPQGNVRPTPSTGGEAANSAGSTTHTTAETTTQKKPSVIDKDDPIIVDLRGHLGSWEQLRLWYQANKVAIDAKTEEWKNEFFPRYDEHAARLKKEAEAK